MSSLSKTTPIGTDIIGWNFGGSNIVSIRVDNPSGSWLSIAYGGTQPYLVPPYVSGWYRNFNPQPISINITFVISPTGTPSSTAGSPPTITISDILVTDSDGVTLLHVEPSTRRLITSYRDINNGNTVTSYMAHLIGQTTDWDPAYSNPIAITQRIRLYSIHLTMDKTGLTGVSDYPIFGVFAPFLNGVVNAFSMPLYVTYDSPSKDIQFGNEGIDLPLGNTLRFDVKGESYWVQYGTKRVYFGALLAVI